MSKKPDRDPWHVRLAAMTAPEIEEMLRGPLLGERKTAQAKARLAELRA